MYTIQAILRIIVYHISFLFPRNRKLAVFGAWEGKRYCDNPKYLMLYFLEHSDIQCVWIGDEVLRKQMPHNANFKFITRTSFKSVWCLLRAKYCFFCSDDKDLAGLPFNGAAFRCNLWHGIPLKWMGVRTPYSEKNSIMNNRLKKSVYHKIRRYIYHFLNPANNWWTVSSSKKMSEIMVASYPSDYSFTRLFECGTPRNDFLIKERANSLLIQELKKKYASLLGFDPAKKIVLYMPTWRMNNNNIFTFYGLESFKKQHLVDILQQANAVLVEKHHHVTLRKQKIDKQITADLIVISSELQREIDPQELYLITDILISDYSSATLDYALLRRPCIHFIYDYEEYAKNDSGLAYNLLDVAVGPCVKTFDEVLNLIRDNLENPQFNPMRQCEELLAFEHGKCSEVLLKYVMR